MQKYRIIEDVATSCFSPATEQVYESGVGLVGFFQHTSLAANGRLAFDGHPNVSSSISID
jgi:hypothetical protein